MNGGAPTPSPPHLCRSLHAPPTSGKGRGARGVLIMLSKGEKEIREWRIFYIFNLSHFCKNIWSGINLAKIYIWRRGPRRQEHNTVGRGARCRQEWALSPNAKCHDVKSKDGNGVVSGQISAGFGSSGFGFGLDFSPTVFGFGARLFFTRGYPMDNRNKSL
jgi:hypothetical protein